MKKPFRVCATFAFALTSIALAQPPVSTGTAAAAAPKADAGPISFEVATIKHAIPLQEQALSGKMHIGVNIDKQQADIGGMSVQDLLTIAFKVKPHQVVGPDWLPVDRFDILAKMPQGATQDDLDRLMQSLLAERFGLKFHHEQREVPIYALVVGKGGIKMKEAEPVKPADAEGDAKEPDAPKKDEKGVMTFGSGDQKMTMRQTGEGRMEMRTGKNGNVKMVMEDGHMVMKMDRMTTEALAAAMSRFVDKPIIDMTELKGEYQMTLELTMEDMMNAARAQGMQIPTPPPGTPGAPAGGASDPSGGSIFNTVQKLGLKLEARKSPIDTIVIDRIEKTPTEN